MAQVLAALNERAILRGLSCYMSVRVFISIVVVTIVGFSTSLIPRFFMSDFSDTDVPIPLEPIKCVVQF